MNLPFSKNQLFQKAYQAADIHSSLTNQITHLINGTRKNSQSLVVVCIGSDRSTGDALGPLTGTALQQYKSSNFKIYGTLKDPVHALNLADTINEINDSYRHPFIIAIDACLGKTTSVGNIQANAGPIYPGAGVNKKLPPIGDVHITGIVNVGGFMEYIVLQNTRLFLVQEMAHIISACLYRSLTTMTYQHPAVNITIR
ncbi:spore protease YyaC [Paenibacillus yanchengensis]|uniref:Spore protease YyaC n=1 Tax=Paenibacillus yanchengensis TaxID=2035833 RepID=A0ABW4YPK6_9BACL